MAAQKQKPRLWIVSELYYPELTSTGYYITGIAEFLSSDAEVRVICGQPNYYGRGHRAAKKEERNNVAITRVAGVRLDKNVLVFRLLNMLTFCLSAFLRALAGFKSGDSVLVVTTPPLLPMVTAFAALIRGAGYTLLVHDVYPEQLFATGILQEGSLIGAAIDLANRWVYKHAKSVITVGRDMKELLEQKIDDLDIPVFFIPNWGETDDITPEAREQNQLSKELGLDDNFVLLCAGNLGRPNDLDTIVAAAKALTDAKVRFVFIGAGAREAWLREATSNLPNVLILPPMPRRRQQLFLNSCDVAIAPLVSGMWGAAVPSRLYNYLAAGKPVIAICERDSELARVVDEDNAGAWAEPGDVERLVQLIRELMNAPDSVSEMGRNARASAIAKYSPESILPLFRKVLIGSK